MRRLFWILTCLVYLLFGVTAITFIDIIIGANGAFAGGFGILHGVSCIFIFDFFKEKLFDL